jgi:hypothetical protein
MASTFTSRKKSYRKPRAGEARKCRKPLRIDRLPQTIKELIIAARAAGESWQAIEVMASAAAGVRVPRTSANRWYDLRVIQRPLGETLQEIVCLLKDIRKAVSE